MSNFRNTASEPKRHRGLRLTVAGAVTAAGSLFVIPAVGPADVVSADPPLVEVTKYVNDGTLPPPGVDANDGDPLLVAPGTPLTFTVEITSISRAAQDLVVGDDTFLNRFSCTGSGDQTITALAPGATETCTTSAAGNLVDVDTAIFTAGVHRNEVFVFDPADSRDDAVTDEANVEIREPSFEVRNYVNDGTFPPPGVLTELLDPFTVEVGTPITITVEVENTGELDLTDVAVRDSVFFDTFDCGDDSTPGDFVIDLLPAGGTASCTVDLDSSEMQNDNPIFGGPLNGAFENRSRAIYFAEPGNNDSRFIERDISYVSLSPLSIEKSVNGDDADDLPGLIVQPDDVDLVFEVVITNELPEASIDGAYRVTDDVFGDGFSCDLGDNVLESIPPGGTVTCEFTVPAEAVMPGVPPFSDAGEHTNVATVEVFGFNEEEEIVFPLASDPANVTIDLDPALAVSKTVNGDDADDVGSALVVSPGEELVFEIIVENVGNIPLNDVRVRDNVFANNFDCGGGSPDIAFMDLGDEVSCFLTVPGDEVDFGEPLFGEDGAHTNRGRATVDVPTPDGPLQVRETDDAFVQIAGDPDLTIVKTVNGEDANDDGDPLIVVPGTDLTFEIEVENTGDVDLVDVRVRDNEFANLFDCLGPPFDIGPGNANFDLAIGETVTCVFELSGSEVDFDTGTFDADGAHRNNGRATVDVANTTVQEFDEANVQLFGEPVLEIVKSVLIEDTPVDANDDEDRPVVPAGEPLTFQIEITNLSGFDVEDIRVRDSDFTTRFDCDADTDGIQNSIPLLGDGETATCLLTLDASEVDFDTGSFDADGVHRNIGRAVVDLPDETQYVVRDEANVELADPAVEIVKSVNGEDANDDQDPLLVDPGTELTFTAEVTNVGNVPLDDVRVRDSDFLGDFECPSTGGPVIDELDPGESETCTFVLDGSEVDFDTGSFNGNEHRNRARAVIDLPDETTLVEFDEANVLLNAVPGLDITKYVNDGTEADPGLDANDGEYLLTEPGTEIVITAVVENTGNIDLVDVRVRDSEFLGRFECPSTGGPVISLLAPGETESCTITLAPEEVAPETGSFDENGVHRNEARAVYDFQANSEAEIETIVDRDEANIVLAPRFRLGNLVWFERSLPPQEFPVYDPGDGDVPVEDIMIELYEAGDDPDTDPPLDTTMPRPDGFYVFEDLPAGDYFVYLPDLPEGTIVARNGETDPNNDLNNNRDHNALPSDSATTNPITLDFELTGPPENPVVGLENTGGGFTNSTLDLALRELPELALDKEVERTRSNPDGTYDIRYLVTVGNTGPGATQYQINDELLYGLGLDPSIATVTAEAVDPALEVESPPINPDFDGQADTLIIRGRTLPGGTEVEPSTHTYYVTVRGLEVDPAMTLEARDCVLDDGEDGRTGSRNVATLQAQFLEEPLEAEDCRPVPRPELVVVKSVIANDGDPSGAGPEFGDDGFEQIADDGTFVVTYEIVVDNIGRGPGVYDLTDELQFGEGITIDSVQVVETTPPGLEEGTWDGQTETLLGDDNAIDGTDFSDGGVQQHRYVIEVAGDASGVTSETRTNDQCQLRGEVSVGGFKNLATVTYFGIEDSDDACADDPSDPDVRKAVDAGPTLITSGPNVGKYSVEYRVAVNNRGGSGEYTLDDVFQFGTGMTADEVTVTVDSNDDDDVTANLNPGFDGTGDTSVLAAPQFIEPGGRDRFSIDAIVSIDPVTFVPAGEGECPDVVDEAARGGFLNVATMAFGESTDTNDGCERVPDPDLSFAKAFADLEAVDNPEDLGGGQWRVTYDVVVTNSGDGVDLYDLDDELLFGAGIDEGDVTVISVTGTNSLSDSDDATSAPITVNAGWNGYSDTSVVAGQGILGQEVHTYRIVVEVDAMALDSRKDAWCTYDGERGGFLNKADLVASTFEGSDEVCENILLPELEINKVVSDGPTPTGIANQYYIEYELEVVNNGLGSGAYDLFDDLTFPFGVEITNPSVTSGDVPAEDILDWPGFGQIVDDQGIDAGATQVYTVSADALVTSLVDPEAYDCIGDPGVVNSGFRNVMNVTDPFDELFDVACANIPATRVTISKSVETEPVPIGDGVYETSYEIDITNLDPRQGVYSLNDELQFGPGIEIVDATVVSSDVIVRPLWTGQGANVNTDVVTFVPIAPWDRHTFVVTVQFTIDPESTEADRDCELVRLDNGTGTLNVATVMTPTTSIQDSACTPVGETDVTIDKTVNGTVQRVADDTYTVVYDIVVDNDGDVSAVYDLVDDPDFGANATITAAAMTSSDVTLPDPAIWDPANDANTVATGLEVVPGTAQTFTATLTVTFDGDTGTDIDECSDGLYNLVEAVIGDETADNADACAEIPPPDETTTTTTTTVPSVPTVPTIPLPTFPPPQPTTPPSGTLPSTGSNATQTGIIFALVMLTGGLALAVVSRRRRVTADGVAED